MDIIKSQNEEIQIVKTITNKIEISEAYFDEVLKDENISKTIDWSGSTPKYKYTKRVKKYSYNSENEWFYDFEKISAWDVSHILKDDLKCRGIKVKGRLHLEFTSKWDDFEEYCSAKLIGIYFIHEKTVDFRKIIDLEIEKQKKFIDRLEYGQSHELYSATGIIKVLKDFK